MKNLFSRLKHAWQILSGRIEYPESIVVYTYVPERGLKPLMVMPLWELCILRRSGIDTDLRIKPVDPIVITYRWSSDNETSN